MCSAQGGRRGIYTPSKNDRCRILGRIIRPWDKISAKISAPHE
jgi:hypothetical protein